MLFGMKRTLALGAAWTASAAAAVGLGFLAVSLVDASASPGPRPVAGTPASVTAPSTSAAPTSAPSSAEQATDGGTVYASCTDGVPGLAGAPAPGWWVDDSSGPAQVEFRSATQKVEVMVSCASGSPVFVVEGPRAEDRSSVSTTPAAPSTSEDSSGGDGGGHGSDDPPGDDSSGRDGGGHGSDD
jgi:hypothetical protein